MAPIVTSLHRQDIQALRGVAVLLVVLNHAGLGPFAAGYLGVDIFFVISGFLITGLIRDGISRGEFSFARFYFRRAKRLLPAAYVTILATVAAAPFVLTSSELQDFQLQVVGAITFTANFTLWQQADYFQGAAELKPLLHVWSLSLEEQYYFLLPALLFLLPRHLWMKACILLVLASLALCVVGTQVKPVATFYLLPTRAWELGLGSVAALVPGSSRTTSQVRALIWPALGALLLVPIFETGAAHPGVAAMVVCSATFAILLNPDTPLGSAWPARPLAKVGDISYALYLVHWPLFAFANNAWVGAIRSDMPTSLSGVLVGVAAGLAYLLHRYVEAPIHRAPIGPTGRRMALVAVLSALVMGLPFAIALPKDSDIDYDHLRRPNFGFARVCGAEELFEARPACRNAPLPRIAVWGDSFAMHLVPGLAALDEGARMGLVQVTMSACGPVLGLGPITKAPGTEYNKNWAQRCLAFQQAAIDHLRATSSIEVVALASPFSGYVTPEAFDNLVDAQGRRDVLPPTESLAIDHLRATVDALRAAGKRVVVVAPPPSAGFDSGRCVERLLTGRWFFGGPADCRIPIDDYHQKSAPVLSLLARVERESIASVIRFDEALCSESHCNTQLDHRPIYRDRGHLSYEGSVAVATRSDLLQQILDRAR